MFVTTVTIQARLQYIRARVMQWHHMRWEKVWLQMVGANRFLPWQLSQNLAKYNENYLTYVKTDH